jgi:nicotinate-nucleotide adenylyltransferase
MLTKLSNSKATKVIIFGGVFDPVHIGHLHIYQTLKSRFQFDRFIIVPAKIPPLKDALPVATINQRLAMLRMMFKKYPNVLISDYELKQSSSTKSYTIGTIKHFRKIFPRAELFLVVGADRYIDFKK